MACMFLLNSLKAGGSETKTVRVVNALHEKGIDVHFGYLNPPDTLREEIRSQLPLVHLDRKGKFDPAAVSRLLKYINRHQIDLLLCVNLYSTLYGAISQGIRGRKNLRCISFVNTTEFRDSKQSRQMAVYWPFLRSCSHIIFGCRNQQNIWMDRYHLNPDKCSFIYNGVDSEMFSPQAISESRTELRRRYGFSQDDVVIVNIGRLRPEKKQEDLIAACAKVIRDGAAVRLVLVGEGPEQSRLMEAAKDAGLSEKVHFYGPLSDVRPVLGVGDIFALSSVSVETFSNSALEAMAMGKPVVLSDIGGASEMVEHGRNGFLYPAADVPALAERLSILVRDPGLRKEMGRLARETVRERFDFDVMLGKYECLLSETGSESLRISQSGTNLHKAREP